MGDPDRRNASLWASLKGTLYKAESVKSDPNTEQDASMALMEGKLGFPLWRGGMEGMSFSTEFRHRRMELDPVLPGTEQPVPHDFYKHEFQVDYWKVNRRGRFFLSTIQVGTSSDVPYASFDEMDTRLFGAAMLPVRKRKDAWMIGLDWSANRTFLNYVPLPGVGYRWCPSESLQVVAGVPFLNVNWDPGGPWSVELSGSPSPSVLGRVYYQLTEDVDLFGEYHWDTEAYFRSDRTDDKERLFYTEHRLETGVAADLSRGFLLEASAGWSIGRSLFENDGFYDGRSEDQLKLEDTFFLRVAAALTVPSKRKPAPEKGIKKE